MDCNLQLKNTAFDKCIPCNKFARQISVSDSMQNSSIIFNKGNQLKGLERAEIANREQGGSPDISNSRGQPHSFSKEEKSGAKVAVSEQRRQATRNSIGGKVGPQKVGCLDKLEPGEEKQSLVEISLKGKLEGENESEK